MGFLSRESVDHMLGPVMASDQNSWGELCREK